VLKAVHPGQGPSGIAAAQMPRVHAGALLGGEADRGLDPLGFFVGEGEGRDEPVQGPALGEQPAAVVLGGGALQLEDLRVAKMQSLSESVLWPSQNALAQASWSAKNFHCSKSSHRTGSEEAGMLGCLFQEVGRTIFWLGWSQAWGGQVSECRAD
jgi:hypothetical protein